MGSMGRRRGRRTRSDEGGTRIDIDSGPLLPARRHSPYTIEGIIEGYGALARWARHPPPTHSRWTVVREMLPWVLAAAVTFALGLTVVWILVAVA
ncbi:MAG: hypothetical protein JO176_14045 [Acidimicrobiia bacterium]|nr:hypothetical protein [Acidimicrobiia bacterium]